MHWSKAERHYFESLSSSSRTNIKPLEAIFKYYNKFEGEVALEQLI